MAMNEAIWKEKLYTLVYRLLDKPISPQKKPMMVVTIPSNPLTKPADSVAKISWVPSWNHVQLDHIHLSVILKAWKSSWFSMMSWGHGRVCASTPQGWMIRVIFQSMARPPLFSAAWLRQIPQLNWAVRSSMDQWGNHVRAFAKIGYLSPKK